MQCVPLRHRPVIALRAESLILGDGTKLFPCVVQDPEGVVADKVHSVGHGPRDDIRGRVVAFAPHLVPQMREGFSFRVAPLPAPNTARKPLVRQVSIPEFSFCTQGWTVDFVYYRVSHN